MAGTATQKSTTVRSFSGPIPAPVRAAFRTLDPIAPALATRWAVRLWCTTPRARRRPPPAAPPGVRFLVPVGRSTVVAESWGEIGAPVTYLVHGWGGWRGQLTGLVAPLVEAGQRVVALDAPGHGESTPGRLGGRRTHLGEFTEAIAAVVAVTGPAHALVAHSGGASAAAVAVRDGLPAGRLAFLAPMANPIPYLRPFADLLGLGRRTRPRLLPAMATLVGRDMSDFDVPSWAGQRNQLPPLLVVHDRRDREVAYPGGQALAAAWPGAVLHTTDGLGHRRVVADPAVVDTVATFVTTGRLGG